MQELMPFDDLSELLPFTVVLDNIDAGIAVYDAKGNFIFVNTVLINWRNIPRKEYLLMNVHDFTSVIDVCVFDLVCQKKRRISRLQYYQDFQKIDGPTRMRIVTGTPIFDGFGNVKYVVTMLQDIVDFENLYHTLLKQNKIVNEKHDTKILPKAEKVSIVAKSNEIKQLLSVASSIAPLDSTVLLYGESGSGKEVMARYIHEHSNRSDKPLITVNCAAFPENLIEAELFGYEKGSFTGANREGKIGLAEAADGGTLFLDEVNSLPMSIQGKVLRMIEEKSIQRIGAIRPKKVDFRLITATNQALTDLVQQGAFREDLYYRLHVIPLTIPPVRNRKEDIVPLCLHFLHYFCQKYNLNKSFSEEVLTEVRSYQWPGNVREIRNFVERMVVMTPSSTTEINSIPVGMLGEKPTVHEVAHQPSLVIQNSGKLSKERIIAALAACDNRREKAAEYLGISRRQLQYKIKEYHIPSRCQYDSENVT
ncbi:Anaerobic nitric oxide reductase transcription regulator NorR [bioreactor metagenome]|uniref:Anaerobic nitric oxide reductase transcription regulator NorR n=1 Tax=bioreactor metagenome TaxID=1076179 RepID=A0A645BCT5_9ZZZZ